MATSRPRQRDIRVIDWINFSRPRQRLSLLIPIGVQQKGHFVSSLEQHEEHAIWPLSHCKTRNEINLCTTLWPTAKEAQAAEILRLKERIKKLKQKREEKSMDDSTTFDDLDIDHGMDYMKTEEDVGERKESDETKKVNLTADTEKVIEDKGSGEKGGSTEELVSTAVLETVSAARPNVVEPEILPTISSIFDDEDITMAQTLIKLKEEKAKEVKAKEKGVTIKDTEDFDRPRTTIERSVLTLKPLSKIDPKDKGKKVLEEEAASNAESEGVNEAERKFAQLERDAEIARKLNEDMQAKLERERIEQEEATKAALIRDYDDIQARIETDRILAARLQEEERESFTVEQRAKFLHDTIAAQRRFLAQQRSKA
ncbi:hypothetical protein Tco_1116059, partial [Tanacetum coccineum]